MNLLSKIWIFLLILILFNGCSQEVGDKAYYNMLNRAISYFEKGDLQMAESGFRKAAMDPRKAEGFFWLARVKEITTPSRSDEIALYERSIKINPKYVDAYSRVGFAYSATGDFKKAREAWLAQLEQDPDNPEDAYSNIAFTYFLQKDFVMANEYYNRSLERNPNYTYGLNGLAKVYSASKRFGEAKDLLNKSVSVDSGFNNRGVYADFAKLEEMQSNYQEAREYWKKFLSFQNLPPADTAEANKALERIKSKELSAIPANKP